MNPTQSDAWAALAQHANTLTESSTTLLADPGRRDQLCFDLAGVHYDFAKQRINAQVLDGLVKLAQTMELASKTQAMYAGEIVNTSEQRAVLHTALRGTHPDPQIAADVSRVQQRMLAFAEQVRTGEWRGYTNKAITDVVHIGIGGSHLGPELVVNALAAQASSPLRLHFVANIDATDLFGVLQDLNPETTLFVVVSKSWSTLETKVNATSARSWFLERTANLEAIAKHFVAVSSNVPAATEFGLDADNIYPIWDWVGGRYSLWSAVGLPIALSIGEAGFTEFLRGAAEVDAHFLDTPLHSNVPALSGLLATWNYNFLGTSSLAVLAYDERLSLLPEYLQQLEMESNGKSVDIDGAPINYHTMPILWGGTGTRGQHAYHQLLHQGTRQFAADFIVVGKDDHDQQEHHAWLLANALGQSQAMAQGFAAGADETHRSVPGNHPTTTIVLSELGPRQLGALLATYEHKVFTQAAIWNINAFDQWGVELGKKLAIPIFEQISDPSQTTSSQDLSTQQLIERLRQLRLQ